MGNHILQLVHWTILLLESYSITFITCPGASRWGIKRTSSNDGLEQDDDEEVRQERRRRTRSRRHGFCLCLGWWWKWNTVELKSWLAFIDASAPRVPPDDGEREANPDDMEKERGGQLPCGTVENDGAIDQDQEPTAEEKESSYAVNCIMHVCYLDRTKNLVRVLIWKKSGPLEPYVTSLKQDICEPPCAYSN